MTTIVVIAVSVFILNVRKENEKAISIVQNETSKINTAATYKTAFEKYLVDAEWNTYVDSEDNRLVGLEGTKYLSAENRIAKIKFVFLIDMKQGTFKPYKGYIDKLEMSEVDMLIWKIKSFSSYN